MFIRTALHRARGRFVSRYDWVSRWGKNLYLHQCNDYQTYKHILATRGEKPFCVNRDLQNVFFTK